MNQTNLFSGSREPIRVPPHSSIPQPDATRSAQQPLKEALDKQFPMPKKANTPEEAEEWRTLIKECVKSVDECETRKQECERDLRRAKEALRREMYQACAGGVPKLLGMKKQEFRLNVASAGGTKKIPGSTTNEVCLVASMEAALKIPFGEMKEAAFMALHAKVPQPNCREVVALALEKKGSYYRKITVKAIVEAARELGYLKTSADNPAETRDQREAVQV